MYPFVITVTFSTSTLPFQYGSAFAQSKAATRLLKSMVRNGEYGKTPGGNFTYAPRRLFITKAQQSSLAITKPSFKQTGLGSLQSLVCYFADYFTFQQYLRGKGVDFFGFCAIRAYALQLTVKVVNGNQ
jgi:hypothetical protein